MKKIILITLILVMMFSLLSCKKDKEAPEGMQDVAPEKEKYNFYVPQNWMPNSGDIVGAYYSNTDRSNVSVMAYGGEYESSEQYWNAFKARAENIFKDFEVISESEAIVIDGINAVKFCYKMKLDGKEYRCMQAVVAYSNICYVITYTSTPDYYDSHMADVESMLSNFDFK